MKKENMVTIVTVCYNAEKEIKKTIESVIFQKYKNKEYIIIDGNSKDGTLAIVEKYRNDIDIVVSEPDRGIFDAMNKGISRASGDWIIFMNAGDVFADDSILSSVFEQCDYSGFAVLHGDIYRNFKSSENLWKDIPFYKNKSKYKGMNICHQAIFTRASFAKKFPFDLSYKMSADYNMMMNIYRSGGRFYDLNIPIAIYDTTGISNKNRLKTFNDEMCICGVNKRSLTYIFHYMKLKISLIFSF